MPSPAESDRPYDIVLFGASGFVGRLTAAYLRDHAPAGTEIALAGRSRERLAEVRDWLGAAAADWAVEIADAADEDALARLVERTRVLVTTVGPYAKYGMPIVRACAAAGTHYADLTGEVLFARQVIDECQAVAAASGAKIVPSCGFDSIPSDLGVYLLAQAVAASGGGTLGETLLRVRVLKGGFSGGTIDSARHQAIVSAADPSLARIAADSYALSPDRAAEPPSRNRKARRGGIRGAVDRASQVASVQRDSSGRWQAPFVMAGYNTRVVRRSNALLSYAYGRDFRYAEVSDVGTGVRGALTAGVTAATLGGVVVGLSHAPTRKLLDRVLPAPGEGPSEADQAAGRFVMDIDTVSTSGASYRARVAAERDPGYSGTAVMLGESALCLCFDALPAGGGVLTPAVAMGDALIDRLRAQAFTFEASRA